MSQDEKQHDAKQLAALESLKNIDPGYIYDTIRRVLDVLHPDVASKIVKELHSRYCKVYVDIAVNHNNKPNVNGDIMPPNTISGARYGIPYDKYKLDKAILNKK